MEDALTAVGLTLGETKQTFYALAASHGRTETLAWKGWVHHLPPPSDAELQEINSMLDWHAGTVLPDGRLLGCLERTPGKRMEPGRIPDSRIRLLNKLLPLRGKSILEIGSFEGIHTVGLRLYSRSVTAIDVRPQNVIKTMARLSWHGSGAVVFQLDAEKLTPDFPHFDVVFHVGVLYHMLNPVEHLRVIAEIGQHLFLDTHVARENEQGLVEIDIAGRAYRGAYRSEGGWTNPFSGKDSKALWLTEESLLSALADAGLSEIRMLQQRDERNGSRVLLLAGHRESE